MALTWSQKLVLLTQKGLTWKEVQEMDKGLESEKEEPPKEEPPKEPDEKDKRIAELEAQLKEAQADNVHGNNETPDVSFDEQLNEMFKDIRI